MPVASLSKQALSDTGGCRSSTCAGEMPQRHFVFGSSRKFTAAICYLPIDSDAVVLDIYITLPQWFKKKRRVKVVQGNGQVHRVCCWLPTEPACLCWLPQNLPLTSQWTSRILILSWRNHPRKTCGVKENFAEHFPLYMWTWQWARPFFFLFAV